MYLPEMILNTFSRLSPANADSIADLKIQLGRVYSNSLNEMATKAQKNNQIDVEQSKLEEILKNTDEHAPEYSDTLLKFEKLEEQRSKLTLMEKTLSFLEKPYVRLAMMIAFIFISRWVTKKITEKKEDKIEEEEFAQNGQQFGQPFPPYGYQQPYYPNYNPYGSHPPQGQQRR